MSGKFGEKYYDLTLNALRIVAGFLLLIHGGQKLFGWFGAGPMPGVWPFGVAGVLEFFGGLALALGLFTRHVAFVVAGEMAVVYFWMHVARNGSFWPWANRGGEVPALFCFIWLFIWASGGGSKTLDAWLAKRKALALAMLAFLATPAFAQQTAPAPTIQEWKVPWAGTRPRDPYVDRAGRVWFVGQTGHYIGVLDPTTGEFKKFDLAPGAGPHNLIVDSAGIVWYAGNAAKHIGRLDPRDGSIRQIAMSDSTLRDPHTLVWDARGDIWFTAQGGNGIGKLTVATGDVRVVRVPTPRGRPYGIKVDRTGRPWVVLFGTNKLATVDPQTFALTEYPLPRAATRPRRLEITSDGAVWYGDYAAGMLGRFDPRTQKVEEWPLPGGPSSRPYATALDDQGRIWIVETGSQPNRFIGFDTRTRQFLPGADVPSGGGTVRHMVFDPRTRVIWFGTDANTIGKAQLPNPSGTPVP